MNMQRLFFSVIVLLGFIGSCYAQNNAALFKKGNQFYKKGQYKNAFPFYDQILKTDSANLKALYRAGVCNLYRYSKESALSNFQKVYKADSTYDKYLPYWLGRANHLNFNFTEAIDYYNSFLNKISSKSVQYKEVQRYIYQATCGLDYIANPSNNYVRNLGPVVNSAFSDHSPITSVTDTFILFTSRRTNIPGAKEEFDGEPFEDIFYSSRNAKGEWSKPESFHLNTTGHDASIQMFDNDTKLFIYSYLHDGDIHLAEKVNGTWQTPVPVNAINSVDFEADAFMTSDGKTIYFASNHLKKNGDLDICFVSKDSTGKWSKPMLLPSVINTDEDEDAPYITADGKRMYFSSRGHTSMGGYDVFESVLDSTGNWGKPVNLDYPINTPDDDLYYCLSSKSTRAFMSSYRTGGYGEKDIYEVIEIQDVLVKGLLVEENQKIINAEHYKVSIIPLETASKNAVAQVAHVSAGGRFEVTCLSDNGYKVIVSHLTDTLVVDTLTLKLQEEKNQEILYTCFIPSIKGNIAVDTLPVGADTTEVKSDKIQKTIYFALHIFEVGPASKNELRALIAILEKNSRTTITVYGHTDGSGPEEFNAKLSAARANSVKKYLLAKGVDPSRIIVESFGSHKPIASNDTEEGKAKNRRVELIIE